MAVKDQHRIVVRMLDRLQRDMLTAVERLPAEWNEIELGWYLVRAEMFHRTADRLRRKAFENALRRHVLS
jgi:hypothetical protein